MKAGLLAARVGLMAAGLCMGLGAPVAGAAQAHQSVQSSGRISGVVLSPDGTPIAGQMVTAEHVASGMEITRFTDATGHYSIGRLQPGAYKLRAKGGKWATTTQDIKNLGSKVVTANFKLKADPDFLKRLPSSKWLALLPDGNMKKRFILYCDTCHEMSYTRVIKDGKARTEQGWKDAIALMHGMDVYHNIPPEFNDNEYAHWLATNFSDKRIATLKPPAQMDPKLGAKVRYTEYRLPNPKDLPHDLVIGPDGRIWVTAFFDDVIWAIDPATGATETYQVKADDNKKWGQVRALKFDKKGMLWVVLGNTHAVVRLNPKTRKFQTYDVGMYAHSLDIDSHGNIWVNDYFTKPERIAMLNAKTGKVTVFNVPSANLTKAQGLPLPYGLRVDAKDRVWSSQLVGNTLVRFDVNSHKGKLYWMPAPYSGPRRMALGIHGEVWVPEWDTGHLDKFNPETEKFTRYDFGDSAAGFYDARTDPRTGVVWLTGSLNSAMVRFDPATATWQAFPVPTEPALERHIAIDPKNGDVWTAYSSLPAVHPKVLRIELKE